MAGKQNSKPFVERLADRVYLMIGYVFIFMGVALGLAWWGSAFRDYIYGSLAVYLLGSGFALQRLQEFFDAHTGIMTRQSGLKIIKGLPAQLWSLFWIFSFAILTGLGIFFVFEMASGRKVNILAAVIVLLGLAGLRLTIYLRVISGKLRAAGWQLPNWAQAITALGLLLVFWLVVVGMVQILGLPTL